MDSISTTRSVRRRASLRRRYQLVTAGLLAVLTSMLAIGFAADSASSTVTASTANAGVLLHAVGGTLSTTTPPALPHTSDPSDWAPAVDPAWDVAANSAGGVDTAGDIAYIDAGDATATSALVSIFVTNLEDLAVNYSSWTFDMRVAGYNNTGTAWYTESSDTANDLYNQQLTMTSDVGSVSFVIDDLDTVPDWAITLESGSFYAIQTDTTNGSLDPSFFIRVTQL